MEKLDNLSKKYKIISISQDLVTGKNIIQLSDFSINYDDISSYKIGITLSKDGGIYWSPEYHYKDQYYSHGFCHFFSSDINGWATSVNKPADSYIGFNYQLITIIVPKNISVVLYLKYL